MVAVATKTMDLGGLNVYFSLLNSLLKIMHLGFVNFSAQVADRALLDLGGKSTNGKHGKEHSTEARVQTKKERN